jgi:YebC/PmpR family DNA-binding regulatory protein
MAGHNKWSQIKHKKAKEDAKKSKYFTKIGKEITVAARERGGNPDHNPRLRLLLEKAKEVNMPQENALRAIKKGTGELPGVTYESCMYEGYGPENIALLIDVLTDNKNRAIMELRTFFNKNGGVIAESGAVSWMFNKYGVVKVNTDNATEDNLLELLIAYDIKDIKQDGSLYIITTDPKELDAVKTVLKDNHITHEYAEIEWVCSTPLSLDDDARDKAYEFLSNLEDLDDVQNIYTNLT